MKRYQFHDYNADCQCFRCKGIRNDPRTKHMFAHAHRRKTTKYASRQEQHERYLDCGSQNWDDRESPSRDY